MWGERETERERARERERGTWLILKQFFVMILIRINKLKLIYVCREISGVFWAINLWLWMINKPYRHIFPTCKFVSENVNSFHHKTGVLYLHWKMEIWCSRWLHWLVSHLTITRTTNRKTTTTTTSIVTGRIFRHWVFVWLELISYGKKLGGTWVRWIFCMTLLLFTYMLYLKDLPLEVTSAYKILCQLFKQL